MGEVAHHGGQGTSQGPHVGARPAPARCGRLRRQRLDEGFIVALTGSIMTMPGLGKAPAAHKIDVLEDGTIVGPVWAPSTPAPR